MPMKHASEFRVPIRNPLPDPDDNPAARARIEAAWVHGFCVAIIDSYAEQVFHNGQRCRYGLTEDDVRYARAVCRWADYAAATASWMDDSENRYAHSRAAAAGLAGLDEAQQARLSSRPKAPDSPQPDSMRKPPNWPADAAAADATAVFFAARQAHA